MPCSAMALTNMFASKFYLPCFTHPEIEILLEKQRGKQSEERVRQSACTFIENVGIRVGL